MGMTDTVKTDIDEILKKYDRESNVRIWTGTYRNVLRWFTAFISVFLIWMNMFAKLDERVRRPLFVGILIILVFLYYPAGKGKQRVNHIPWYDLILMAAGSFCWFFYPANLEKIVSVGTRIQTVFHPGGIPLLIVFGIAGILVLVECCRRVTGIPIIIVAGGFLLYAFIAGGKDLKTIVYNLFYTTTGVLGTPIGVCSTYIALFVIFGAFLESTGVSGFFIDFANCLAGWASGGPAKVAVISSALCGMVSGSSVGNTVTTGTVTIPMMKKIGYPSEFAGAVEAAASTGGQIMPPIMGAAAFLMAEMVGVSYSDIVIRAILPAVLYFLGIFLMVHLMAKKLSLKGIPKEELPQFQHVIKSIYLLLPLIALVCMIMNGFTMATSAVYAILTCICVSMIKAENGKKSLLMAFPLVPVFFMTFFAKKLPSGTFLGDNCVTLCVSVSIASMIANFVMSRENRSELPKIVDALENGTKNFISVGVACGIAGIIAGVVTMTGLGQVLIGGIVRLSGGRLLIALILTMLCCIVLGMGVPTTANYIIMATTCAPILTSGMGMNRMAAHMFCFYFGIVADITPPVALAAYAGSAIAKAPPMKTAFNASRLAIAAFLIPYIFAFDTSMLFIDTGAFEVILVVITSIIGMLGVSGGVIGYLRKPMGPLLRILSAAGGILMIIPGITSDIVGILMILAVLRRSPCRKQGADSRQP